MLTARGGLAQYLKQGWQRHAGSNLETSRETRTADDAERLTRQRLRAFPKQRKEPLTDAQHVRNAVARFDQVIDVSDADRALAFANIEKAANYYDVNLAETSWHDLGIHPQKKRSEPTA
ncbi:MAG: DUF6582 domain-containing protein [Terriglobales bacterium]